MVAASEWKGGRPGEPIFTGSGLLKISLSLPDIAQVDRRNQAYNVSKYKAERGDVIVVCFGVLDPDHPVL